jgi:hypothetical protein
MHAEPWATACVNVQPGKFDSSSYPSPEFDNEQISELSNPLLHRDDDACLSFGGAGSNSTRRPNKLSNRLLQPITEILKQERLCLQLMQ